MRYALFFSALDPPADRRLLAELVAGAGGPGSEGALIRDNLIYAGLVGVRRPVQAGRPAPGRRIPAGRA